MPVNAGYLLLAGGGAIFLWSGFRGKSVTGVTRALIGGDNPAKLPTTNNISGSPAGVTTQTSPAGGTITAQGGQPAGTDAQNQALGRMMAGAYGWGSGAEWTALNNIVMAESGWSSTVVNPGSTASGIAQNINGFGPNYQSGNAQQQIAWLLAYIKQRYGDPISAWAFHLANGWY